MKFIGLFIILIFSLAANMGAAMSFFKTKEVDTVLFSEMSGVITFQGEPVADVKLDLSLSWDEGEQSIHKNFSTNHEGVFHIPKITRKISTSPLVQLVINQTIIAHHDGKKYEIWIMGKMDGNEFSETGGQPLNFSCELKEPLRRVEIKSGLLATPCKWELAKQG